MSLSSEAVAMGTSALWVAAAAVPVGGACAYLARRWREPVVPRYQKTFARWDGFDAAVLFLVCTVLPLGLMDLLDKAGVFQPLLGGDPPATDAARFDYLNRRRTVTGLLLMPVVMAGFLLWKARANKEVARPRREMLRRFVADVAAGVAAWVVLTPATLAVHFVVNAFCAELDIAPEEHPLKGTQFQTPFDVLLFFAGTCVAAPFLEEMAFRRVLIPWAARGPTGGKLPPALTGWPYRAAILLACALLFASSRREGKSVVGPLVFVGVAALAFGALAFFARRIRLRPAAAVLASATFFAAVHSNVWPTPIPLLVLGVGLGWLVLRTKTVTAAVVAHGLFNAVSAVFLVRSP